MEKQKYDELAIQAITTMRYGDYEKAIKEFTKAIGVNSKEASLYSLRGTAYGQLGQFDQGIKDFSKAIELDPEDDSNYFSRGSFYAQSCQYDQSIKDYTEVIRFSPDNYLAYLGRGAMYSVLNQNDKARKDFEKVISLNPDDVTLSDAKNMLSKLKEVKSKRVGLSDLCLLCRMLPTENGMSVEDFLTTLSNNPEKWFECGGNVGVLRILNNAIVMSDDGCTTCGGKILDWAKELGLLR